MNLILWVCENTHDIKLSNKYPPFIWTELPLEMLNYSPYTFRLASISFGLGGVVSSFGKQKELEVFLDGP